jgi:hypothetical protein
MRLPRDGALDDVRLELAPDQIGSVHAHANQPDAALRKGLNCRNSNALGQAPVNDIALTDR